MASHTDGVADPQRADAISLLQPTTYPIFGTTQFAASGPTTKAADCRLRGCAQR